MLSISGSKVVWSEFNYDARWTGRDYSVIKLYDFNTDKLKSMTHKSKLMSPSLSDDGSKVCAIENSVENKNTLIIFDVNGKEIKRLINTDNALYINPRWSKGNEICSVKLLNGLKTIVLINIESGFEAELFTPLTAAAENPVPPRRHALAPGLCPHRR